MSEFANPIPLRCRGCHRFIDDISNEQYLSSEIDIIESNRPKLELARSPSDIDMRLADLALWLSIVRAQLQANAVYTVGCPGPDMSDLAGSGQTVRIARCRSPLED